MHTYTRVMARSPGRSAVGIAAAVAVFVSVVLVGPRASDAAFSFSRRNRSFGTPSADEHASEPSYRYFAYGSNVVPSTMMALRGLRPVHATAAVLPDYRLVFAGSNLVPAVESSAAFVEPCPGAVVHGVLYTLTSDDFVAVGRTEGVPFAYRWARCNPVPYLGDASAAGRTALRTTPSSSVDAYALVPGQTLGHSPPSSSYLGLIREGAERWGLDADYRQFLDSVDTAKGLIPPQGTSGLLLRSAEIRAGKDREYYWKTMLSDRANWQTQ